MWITIHGVMRMTLMHKLKDTPVRALQNKANIHIYIYQYNFFINHK